MIVVWKKVPPVLTGGKTHLWVCYVDKVLRYYVVWDEWKYKWSIQGKTCRVIKRVATAEEGKEYVERLLKKEDEEEKEEIARKAIMYDSWSAGGIGDRWK